MPNKVPYAQHAQSAGSILPAHGSSTRPRGTKRTREPLARAVLTKDQLKILQKLSKDESITTDTTNKIYYEGFKQDILRLRGVDFIENKEGKSGLSDLEQAGGIQDARTYFQVRQEGERFLALLERLPPSPSGC